MSGSPSESPQEEDGAGAILIEIEDEALEGEEEMGAIALPEPSHQARFQTPEDMESDDSDAAWIDVDGMWHLQVDDIEDLQAEDDEDVDDLDYIMGLDELSLHRPVGAHSPTSPTSTYVPPHLTTRLLAELTDESAAAPAPPAQADLTDEDPQEQSHICLLPDEILLAILKNVSLFQLFEASLVCKRFCRLSREKSLRTKTTFLVEGFRSHQNYDPLIRLLKGGFSQKKMLMGPVAMKSIFEQYNKEVDTLTLRNCIIYSPDDAIALLHRLQRIQNLVLINIDLTCSVTQKVLTHCFERLQCQDKLHLKSIHLGVSTMDNSKLKDITSILPYAEEVDMGSFGFNRGLHMSFDQLGFVQELLRIPRSARKVRSLSMNATSAVDGQDIGRLASVIPYIQRVDLRHSNFSQRSLGAIAEAIRTCDLDELALETIVFEDISYSKEEFVRRFKPTRMHDYMDRH